MKTFNGSKLFFASDQHFFHANIIKFCNRPFKSVEEMNQFMIDAWNVKVPEDADVIFTGDLGWMGTKAAKIIIDQLNGRFHWILGNHDPEESKLQKFVDDETIASLGIYDTLKVLDPEMDGGHQTIVVMHYPIARWWKMEKGSWMIHGHTHGSFDNGPGSDDCGYDNTGEVVSSYNDMKIRMYTKSANLKKNASNNT